MDYRAETGEATSWRRAKRIVISNELGQTPFIVFSEEDVISIGGKEAHIDAMTAVRGDFDPASGTIPLVNPQTGVPLGESMTHADLYVVLYSLYLQLATARDAAAAPPEEP